MTGRLNLIPALAAAAMLAAPSLLTSGTLEAQERYRVLVPDLFSSDGVDRRFGERVAEEMRELLSELPTHRAIEKKEINDNLNKFKMKMDELDCVKTRQLGSQINAQLAVCASHSATGDNRQITAIEVWDLGSSESFDIDPVSATKDGHVAAAQQILAAFEAFNQQLRFSTNCGDYAASQLWDEALRNCEQALELNPSAISTLYMKGTILRHLNRYDEALVDVERVLEDDPYREDALQLAGYLATQLQQNDKGREYYGRYLETNPGDVAVRRKIAYDIYEAGDAEGAMLFIEQGLAVAEDVDLFTDFGNYAFQAGIRASQATPAENGGTLAPQVAQFYTKAIGAYMKVYEAKGAEMDVAQLRNVVNAHIQLGQNADAIRVAEDVLRTHPNEAAVLATYSTALQRADRLDDALAALKRIEAVDPAFPDLHLRQGVLLLNVQRFDEALPLLKLAVERGGQDPNQVARMILGQANNNGLQKENWDYAIRLLEGALTFPVGQEGKEELSFYLAHSIFSKAVKAQEPSTMQSAQATLPMFQRARDLFTAARGHDQRQGGRLQLATRLEATNTYIEIQEGLIKRGR